MFLGRTFETCYYFPWSWCFVYFQFLDFSYATNRQWSSFSINQTQLMRQPMVQDCQPQWRPYVALNAQHGQKLQHRKRHR
jgi:hypothetical protein